jgi:hypothetical protein
MLYVGSDDGCLYALGEGMAESRQTGPARRAVFWDPQAKHRFFKGDKQVHDFFAENGYVTLEPKTLAGFLKDRIKDGTPSAIVFASDILPEELANDSGIVLFRDYLAKGKALWLGVPPLYVEWDPATGRPKAVKPERTEKVLGVRHANVYQDSFGTTITPDGYRWGLRQWTLGAMAVDPQTVSTILAVDEQGKAAAWVKNYNASAPASGFVRLWGRPDPYPNLKDLKALAEYGID